MAWLNKSQKEPEVPERFKNRTWEQIGQDLDERDAEIARLKTVETELATTKSSLTSQQTELEGVRQQLGDLKTQLATAQGTKTGEKSEDQGPASFLVDEDKAFNDRARPLVDQTLANSSRLAQMVAEQKITAKPKNRFLLNKFRDEYDAFINKLSPVQRTLEEAYLNVFKIVVANHMEEITTGGDTYFVENHGAPPNHDAPKSEKLTEAEQKIARRFGMTDEDYLKRKKEMTVIAVQD